MLPEVILCDTGEAFGRHLLDVDLSPRGFLMGDNKQVPEVKVVGR